MPRGFRVNIYHAWLACSFRQYPCSYVLVEVIFTLRRMLESMRAKSNCQLADGLIRDSTNLLSPFLNQIPVTTKRFNRLYIALEMISSRSFHFHLKKYIYSFAIWRIMVFMVLHIYVKRLFVFFASIFPPNVSRNTSRGVLPARYLSSFS